LEQSLKAVKMIRIKTKKFINATIEAPPSKSYTNRALIIAALAKGKSVLKNPLFSEDTEYMISALKQLGVRIEKKKKDLAVYGTGGIFKPSNEKLSVGNAGTAMRFLASLACLVNGKTVITGDKRMQERPVQDLLDALSQMHILTESNNGCPPVTVHGGNFAGGKIKLKGKVSSQYLSSLLMCAPYAKENMIIEIQDELTSIPYVDITLDIMQKFGIKVKNRKYRKFEIKANRAYKAKTYNIEGDASSASYFFAAAAVTKGKVKVTNINPKTKQGDIQFVEILKKMGCKVKKGKDYIEVKGGKMKGVKVNMNRMPDVALTLAVTALFADGETTIKNVPNLRVKETDRLRALSFELRKMGGKVEELPDGIIVRRTRFQKAIVETYDDHRMVMSFAVAGLVINGIRIMNPGCVKKSFPDFWEKFNSIYEK